MKQLDYRVAELEQLQTYPTTTSSSTQPTTTELQLHQEIQQLAHQLQDTHSCIFRRNSPTGARYDGPPNRTIETMC